ncbi:hypothetical protein ABH307_00535 [Acinetobacter pittii]|uniref:hypothetical protein n=1 Tax=Acinetobacter pittii TaxID=48296 RepID=UPI003260B3A8
MENLYLDVNYIRTEKKTTKFFLITASILILGFEFLPKLETLFFKTNYLQVSPLVPISLILISIFMVFSELNQFRKVPRELLNDLVSDKNHDQRLANSIKEIYKIKGKVSLRDLQRIRQVILLELEDYYDETLKHGNSLKYTKDDALVMSKSEAHLLEIIKFVSPSKPRSK